MRVDYEPNHFILRPTYREHYAVKTIPGVRARKDDTFHLPATWAGVVQLAKVFPGQVDASDGARRIAKTLTWEAQDAHAYNHTGLDERLYPFQKDGVSWAIGRDGLLADEMGLGKTVQSLQALDEFGPVLVVTTNSMKHKWVEEAHSWASHLEPVVLEGGPKKRNEILDQADELSVIICNWEQLRTHSRLAAFGSIAGEGEPGAMNKRWRAVIADEAHKAKSPKAKQTRALWAIGETADVRLAMTGTPLADSPDDLWSIMHFVSPQEWPTRGKFRERYCIMRDNGFGIENIGIRPEMQEEFDQIFQPLFMRRTKAQVLTDLPDKTYVNLELEMTPKQRKAYKDLAEAMITVVDDEILVAIDPLTLTLRLRQVASATPEVVDGQVVDLHAPSNKLSALVDILEDHGSGIVVFADSKKLINFAGAQLEKAGYSCGYITGDIGPALRTKFIDSFQTGDLDVMLATTQAGGAGITLTRADTLVFLQQPWSNIDYLQAQDRVHRIGQESNVTIINLISENTVDQAVAQALTTKNEQLQRIVRDDIRTVLYGGSDF